MVSLESRIRVLNAELIEERNQRERIQIIGELGKLQAEKQRLECKSGKQYVETSVSDDSGKPEKGFIECFMARLRDLFKPFKWERSDWIGWAFLQIVCFLFVFFVYLRSVSPRPDWLSVFVVAMPFTFFLYLFNRWLDFTPGLSAFQSSWRDARWSSQHPKEAAKEKATKNTKKPKEESYAEWKEKHPELGMIEVENWLRYEEYV